MAERQVVQSYRDLEVYQLSFEGAVKIHLMTMQLPKHEMYEEGSQVRRAAKSIPANIAEGFGRRRYTNEFIRFLTYALASCDETRVHLDLLHETGSLQANEHASLSPTAMTDSDGRSTDSSRELSPTMLSPIGQTEAAYSRRTNQGMSSKLNDIPLQHPASSIQLQVYERSFVWQSILTSRSPWRIASRCW